LSEEDPPPCPSQGRGVYSYELRVMSDELPTVILNLVQDLTASLYLFFSADRC
jgi:hypothetical protein